MQLAEFTEGLMFQNRKIVKSWGREWEMMMLPTFSLSSPNSGGWQRLVFDWGKSMSHPHAQIAFAFMDNHSIHINKIVFRNKVYAVSDIRNCRSGRKAAIVRESGNATFGDCTLIDALMAQEFPNKSTV